MTALSFGLLTIAAIPPIVSSGGSYETETDNLLARFTGTYDTTRQGQINTFIKGLKDDGVWTLLDCLQIYAAAASGDALLNWKATNYTASLTNAPSFTANRGFTTNGSNNYIDTQFNPSAGTPNYALNSASIGLYCRSSGVASTVDVGCNNANESGTDGTQLITNQGSNTMNAKVNSPAGASGTIADGSGLSVISRTSSTGGVLNKNGASAGTFTVNATAIPLKSLFVGCTRRFAQVDDGNTYTAFFTSKQYAAFFAGGGMTNTQLNKLYTRMQAYMTEIGANV